MADILTTIVERRTADMNEQGVCFGIEIPSERQRPVHHRSPQGAQRHQ